MTNIDKNLQNRFDENVFYCPSGCWIWTGNMLRNEGMKYGRISISGKRILAHRLSYILHKGDINNDLCVLHRCDNPSCVNPDHLFLGTYADNNRDRDLKGRTVSKPKFGEENPSTKITEDDVMQIRMLCNSGVPQSKIAIMFKISQSNVCHINTGKTWSHISIS